MMKLSSYLEDTKTSQADFAALVGVKQPTVNRWVNGARPSLDAAFRIQSATGGKVSVDVWGDTHSISPSSSAPLREAS